MTVPGSPCPSPESIATARRFVLSKRLGDICAVDDAGALTISQFPGPHERWPCADDLLYTLSLLWPRPNPRDE